jgi:hypothetical protein
MTASRLRVHFRAGLLGAFALGLGGLGWLSRAPESAPVPPPAPSRILTLPAPAAVNPATPDLNGPLAEGTAAIRDWRTRPPETFTLQLSPGLRVPFRVTRLESSDRRTVLTARIDGAQREQPGLEGAFLVGTATASDRWDAVAVFPGMEYRIRVRGAEVSVEEAPTEPLLCLAEAGTLTEALTTAPAPDAALPANEDTPTVDVLVLVNAQALAERNNDLLRIDADCANYVAASNAVLENSRITAFVWRYLLALPAPAYPTDQVLENDLEAMRRGTALAAHIAALKPQYGADQVMMLAGGLKTDAAGYAYVGGSSNLAAMNYPFPTFVNGNRSTVTTSYFTFCHELAHNFGARHSRLSSDSNASDGDERYYYGHRFTDQQSNSNPVETVGTVMATGSSYRIPYYSHPDITFRGVPLGVAVDQLRAAHNARFLAERAPTMVASATAVQKPVITRQPASVQVTAGQAASLAVTATGSGLTYRWMKDGVALANATSFTLNFAAAAIADAGVYTVTASNFLGTVTSTPATLAVTAPVIAAPAAPPVAPAATPAAASSGGGGALSGPFLSALLLLALLRRLTITARG